MTGQSRLFLDFLLSRALFLLPAVLKTMFENSNAVLIRAEAQVLMLSNADKFPPPVLSALECPSMLSRFHSLVLCTDPHCCSLVVEFCPPSIVLLPSLIAYNSFAALFAARLLLNCFLIVFR